MIIESPNKVHTLHEFLSKNDWSIIATVGHIRELKKRNGYDPKTFEPVWEVKKPGKQRFGFGSKNKESAEVMKTSQQIIDDINAAAHKATNIYIASDPDREGEAIAWHVAQVLNDQDRKKVKRVTFNEITKDVVIDAIKHPRKIDIDLVHAYFARTIMDQMIGFGLSRLVREKLHADSAGRVQTVALKFIYDREKEIEAFSSDKWYTSVIKLDGPFQSPLNVREASKKLTGVKLYLLDNKDNQVKNQEDASITAFADEESCKKFNKSLGKYFTVYKKDPETHKTTNPKSPFKTSALLSLGASVIGSASIVKQTAQHLFEGIKLHGKHVALITYPRTDSIRVSDEFVNNVKKLITKEYGASMYVPRKWEDASAKKTTSKIQGAHEAIRVTDPFIKPSDIKSVVKPNEYKLYKLIWMRSVAAFMPECKSISITLRIENNGNKFYTHNTKIISPGFRTVYTINEDEKKSETFDFSIIREGDKFTAKTIEIKEKEKSPPSRYNEASLINKLEEEGVGRPSTYYTMVHKPVESNYAFLESKAFHMNKLGDEVIVNLEKFFPDIVTPVFTKELEDHLDRIEDGEDWHIYLKKYSPVFTKELETAENKFKKAPLENAVDEHGNVRLCPKCKSPLVKRYSPKTHKEFIGCSAYPLCNYVEFPKDPNHHPQQVIEEKCPLCGANLAIRTNRRNEKFIGCTNYPKCHYSRPADMTDEQWQKHKAETLLKKGKEKPSKTKSSSKKSSKKK